MATEQVIGYRAYGQERALDNSQLPYGSLVCMNCSWASDEEETDASLIGTPCAICGAPVEPHDEEMPG